MSDAFDPKITRIMVNPRHKIEALACSTKSMLAVLCGASSDPTLYTLKPDASDAAEPFDGSDETSESRPLSAALLPDDSLIVLHAGRPTLRHWDLKQGSYMPLTMGLIAEHFTVTPDGKRIVTAHKSIVRVWERDAEWPADAKPSAECKTGSSGEVRSLAWSPDGRYFAFGGTNGAVTLIPAWKSDEAITPIVLHNHRAAVVSLAWSPDGKLLASGSDDRTVCVWRTEPALAGREDLLILRGHADAVSWLGWSQRSTLLITATAKTMRLWSTDGRCVRSFEEDARIGGPFALMADGRRLIATTSNGYDSDRGQRKLWQAAAVLDFGGPLEHDPRYAEGRSPPVR